MSHKSRLAPLDALRGFIILVMALDHANGFIAKGKGDPELWYFLFPIYGNEALPFLTRFVTHLAAPGFFFLMGAGMSLFANSRQKQGKSNGWLLGHFALRGGLLILFQFLLENAAWDLGSTITPLDYFGVLYALGGGMIIGSLLLLLPTTAVFLISSLLILATEWLLPQAPSGFATFPAIQLLFTTPGFGNLFVEQTLVLYPILPWLGVLGLGVGFGRFLSKEQQQTYRLLLPAAALMLLHFVFIRILNGYGNIRPPNGDGLIAFFNLVKYPPSLTFLLWTLGINLLLLRLFVWLEQRWADSLRPFLIFGREPLFFYVTHLYLYALMGLWLNQNEGLTILQMLPYWLLGLLILLPFCWGYRWLKTNFLTHPIFRYL